MDNVNYSSAEIRAKLHNAAPKGHKHSFDDLRPYLKNFERIDNYKHAFEYLDRYDSPYTYKSWDADGYIDMRAFEADGKGKLDASLFTGSGNDLILSKKNVLSGIKEYNLDCNIDDVEDILIAIAKLTDYEKSQANIQVKEKFKDYNLPDEILETLDLQSTIEAVEIDGNKYNKCVTTFNNDNLKKTLYVDKNGIARITKEEYLNSDSEIKEIIYLNNEYGEFESSTTKYSSGVTETFNEETQNITFKQNNNIIETKSDGFTNFIILNQGNDHLEVKITPIYERVEEGFIPKIIDINMHNNGQSIEFKDKEKLLKLLNNKSVMFGDYQLKVTSKGKSQIVEIIEKQ